MRFKTYRSSSTSPLKIFQSKIILIALLCLVQNITCDVFTAITEMEDLLDTEVALITNLEKYISAQEQRLDYLKLKVNEYQKEHTEAKEDVSTYLANPINAYLLTKRLTTDWTQIEHFIQDSSNEIVRNITEQKTTLKFPSYEDLNGAAVALIRLQQTYNLDTSSIARGELNGVQYSTELSSDDCFELGKQAYFNQDHYHSVMWMREALKLIENTEQNENVDATKRGIIRSSKISILEYLSYSLYQQDYLVEAEQLNNVILSLDPTNKQGNQNKDHFAKQIAAAEQKRQQQMSARGDTGDAEMLPDSYKVEKYMNNQYATYEKLCRDDIKPTPAALRPMRCRYVNNQIPFLLIGPFKVEEVSLSPRIVVFHDVISEREINKAIEIGKPRLKRATAREATGYVPVKYRISKSGWIKHDEDPLITSIIRRISDMTMLSTETAEYFQVCNYGIGGHYEPHFDFSTAKSDVTSDRLTKDGNRIATVLFYMSEVPQGGATVFTDIKKSVWPKKGSAAFWFNLFASGEGDIRTKHAGCPVLTGSKWVANLWLHEGGQVCYPNSFQEMSSTREI